MFWQVANLPHSRPHEIALWQSRHFAAVAGAEFIVEAKIESAAPASADPLALIEKARADEAALNLDIGEAAIVKVIRPPKSRFDRSHPKMAPEQLELPFSEQDP